MNGLESQNLIGGDWRGGTSTVENINPSELSDIVGAFAHGGAQDLSDAIAAARSAFPAWSQSNILQRTEMLMRIGREIEARSTELGELLSREEGKTRPEGIGEVKRAAQIFQFFAAEVVRNAGDTLEGLRDGFTLDITREPLGVIGLITPWNFPIAIPAWKIAPALAYGNCIILKPASDVPASACALAEIIQNAGVPAGVFNLVMGAGDVIGTGLASSPDIDGISFTGSSETGRRVLTACAKNFTRCQLEMGGKNPFVVLKDADLDVAVDCALQGAFGSTGQRCTASSRIIVEQDVEVEFLQKLHTRLGAFTVGHALHEDTKMGPVVSEGQLRSVNSYIELGQIEGAKLSWNRQGSFDNLNGHYISPALFTEATSDMRISREEIFGPVATVHRVQDYDEALAVANDTDFGLCAGIATNSLKHASHFKRNAEVGVVTVNSPTAGLDFHVAFGGRKGSSFGPREQGRYAREFYTVVKTSYTFTG